MIRGHKDALHTTPSEHEDTVRQVREHAYNNSQHLICGRAQRHHCCEPTRVVTPVTRQCSAQVTNLTASSSLAGAPLHATVSCSDSQRQAHIRMARQVTYASLAITTLGGVSGIAAAMSLER